MIFTVRLDEELGRLLTRAARKLKVKKSELVRVALREYLSREVEEAARPFDLVSDLVGAVEGPPDLSWNPKGYIERRLRIGD